MAFEFNALPFLYPHKGEYAEGAKAVAREESKHKVSALVHDDMEDKRCVNCQNQSCYLEQRVDSQGRGVSHNNKTGGKIKK